jgi:hypothetical protein
LESQSYIKRNDLPGKEKEVARWKTYAILDAVTFKSLMSPSMALTQADIANLFEQQKTAVKVILHEEILEFVKVTKEEGEKKERKEETQQKQRDERNVSTDDMLTQF